MKTVFSIHETKTHLSRLLQSVEAGSIVVFGTRGRAQYQITKVKEQPEMDRSKAFGIWKDKIKIKGDIVSPDPDVTKLLEDDPLFNA